MTRRTAEVTIPQDGADVPERRRNRDGGKIYILTEWDAVQAERWADRAFISICNSGQRVNYVAGSGMAGIAFVGLKALLGVNESPAIELLEELMQCVKRKMPAAPLGRDLVENDIEEVTTRWRLKWEVFSLHTGFSWAEIQQILISAGKRAEDFSNTLTKSQGRSGSSSRKEKRRLRNSRRS